MRRLINYCCQFGKTPGLPHCWYSTTNPKLIVKCYYCPKHRDEVHAPIAFKTKNELITYLTTRALLNEIDDLPPF